MNHQFLTANELTFDVDDDFIIDRADTYDEHLIREKIATDPQSHYYVAVMYAIAGMGNKSTGTITVRGEKKDIKVLMTSLGCDNEREPGSRLEPGDLTPKRLARAFRYMLSDKIERKILPPSFLWRKYNRKARPHLCFPGAEYLITDQDDADNLIAAYEALDAVRGTTFALRVRAILSLRI